MSHQLISRHTMLGYLGAAAATSGALAHPAFAQATSLKIAAVPIEVSAEPFYAYDAGVR